MKAILPLGIAAVVLGFLLGVLGQFPIHGDANRQSKAGAGGANTFNTELVQQTADEFSGAYGWVIEDLVSYQKDLDRPDYERAESQRAAMVSYADALIPQFKELASKLEGQLNKLTGDSASPPQ